MQTRENALRRATDDDNADRAPIVRAFLDGNAPWVDSFAGAGGASLGLSNLMHELISAGMLGVRTIGPDIAINHSPEAIALHKANHPETRHYIEDVFKVDPVRACRGRRPLLMWASPTCTYFSRALGAPLGPESVKLRGLCWVTTSWAASKVRPRVICLENVPEFQKFGPLHKDHSHGCSDRWAKKHAKVHKNGNKKPCCKKRCHFMKPIKAREGSLFRAFINKLRRYYKHVDYRVLTACDFGAPTSRKRFFLIASDAPVTWPEPTHGPGRAHPYRTAAECIDWTIPCPSIFERDKPLADKTLARIIAGAHKFVLDAAKPFIVPAAYGRDEDRSIDVDGPMRTVCGNRGGHALITPYVARTAHGDIDHSGKRRGVGAHTLEAPIGTVCAGGGDYAVAVPYLVHRSNGERPEVVTDDGKVIAGQKPRIYDIRKPLGTVVSGGIKHGLTVPILIKNNGGHTDDCGGGHQAIDAPLDTIATRNTKSLALLYGVKSRGTSESHVKASGFSLDAPLSTISAGGDEGGVHHAQAAVFVTRYNTARDGETRGQTPDEPISTLDTSNRFATVAAYMVRYNGTGDAEPVTRPVGTLTTKERFGLTQITLSKDLCERAMRVAKFLGYDAPLVLVLGGEEWVLVDIGFRMLTPRELYRCQGFPESYKIDPIFEGKPLTKTAQIKGVGNSVPPIMATILGRAALATIPANARIAA